LSYLSACLLNIFMRAKPAVATSALPSPVRSKEISVTVAVATPTTDNEPLLYHATHILYILLCYLPIEANTVNSKVQSNFDSHRA
jgi:hypothetical protein